jgi:hypothetical protein
LIALESSEIVARALFPPEWDENVKRGSPGCFKRNNTSVTRHKDLPFEKVLAYLKADVEKPGSTVIVRAVGLVSVATIKEIGAKNQDPVHFEVFEKKTDINPAHAEVVPFSQAVRAAPNKEVSRGLSRKISDALDITIVTPEGEIEGRSPPQQSQN